jgi:hypothetical protein
MELKLLVRCETYKTQTNCGQELKLLYDKYLRKIKQ